jgi:hypothetical protein
VYVGCNEKNSYFLDDKLLYLLVLGRVMTLNPVGKELDLVERIGSLDPEAVNDMESPSFYVVHKDDGDYSLLNMKHGTHGTREMQIEFRRSGNGARLSIRLMRAETYWHVQYHAYRNSREGLNVSVNLGLTNQTLHFVDTEEKFAAYDKVLDEVLSNLPQLQNQD